MPHKRTHVLTHQHIFKKKKKKKTTKTNKLETQPKGYRPNK